MRILFITRKYPPQTGGMENFSYGLINNIQCEKDTVILNKKQIHLIWWLPYALLIGIIKSFKADIVHLGDGLLAPLGVLIKIITGKKVIATVHGLDVTYKKYFYQKINVGALKYLDKIICVSKNTKKDCLAKNISEKKLIVIPDGVDVDKFKIANFSSQKNNKKILLTVGRLIKRKGVAWFIQNVMPKLDENIKYLVVGQGDEKINIMRAVKDNDLKNRVELLGYVSEEKLKELYNTADLFIMPNIKIEEDREGFGIVAIEAAVVGLPVVAAGIEGIKDAIINEKNGFLTESENAQAFIDKINELLAVNLDDLKHDIRKYTEENYSWKVICDRYMKVVDINSNKN